jgi:hypothetical protein
MFVFLTLEASQSRGMCRLGFGCFLHPNLASMVDILSRLF